MATKLLTAKQVAQQLNIQEADLLKMVKLQEIAPSQTSEQGAPLFNSQAVASLQGLIARGESQVIGKAGDQEILLSPEEMSSPEGQGTKVSAEPSDMEFDLSALEDEEPSHSAGNPPSSIFADDADPVTGAPRSADDDEFFGTPDPSDQGLDELANQFGADETDMSINLEDVKKDFHRSDDSFELSGPVPNIKAPQPGPAPSEDDPKNDPNYGPRGTVRLVPGEDDDLLAELKGVDETQEFKAQPISDTQEDDDLLSLEDMDFDDDDLTLDPSEGDSTEDYGSSLTASDEEELTIGPDADELKGLKQARQQQEDEDFSLFQEEEVQQGAGASIVDLDQTSEDDDDFVLSPSPGDSDLTLQPSDSGIGIGSSSSGIGLGDSGIDLGSGLNLGGSDADMDLGGSDPKLASGSGVSQPSSASEFLLSPSEEEEEEESDSGSQVIALDADDESGFNEGQATMLDEDPIPSAPGMGGMPSGMGMGSAPGGYGAQSYAGASSPGMGSGIGSPEFQPASSMGSSMMTYAPRPEAMTFGGWGAATLALCLLIIIFGGIMMFEMMRFIAYSSTPPIMNFVLGLFG